MTPAALVLAAMVAGWGPVWPAPEAPEGGASAAAAPAPEAAAAPTRPAPAAPAPAPTKPPAPAAPPAIIAKAPVEVRARPVLVAAPRPAHEPRKPMHKQWAFWAIAGGFFVAAVIATYAATRPAPQAYRGNASPYYVPFP